MNDLFIISEMDELHKILEAVNERLRIVAMSVADSKVRQNGEWVKFDNIKELLNTAHNSQSTQCSTCDRKSRGCDCKITCAAFIPIGD
jgi:hypothetical protein